MRLLSWISVVLMRLSNISRSIAHRASACQRPLLERNMLRLADQAAHERDLANDPADRRNITFARAASIVDDRNVRRVRRRESKTCLPQTFSQAVEEHVKTDHTVTSNKNDRVVFAIPTEIHHIVEFGHKRMDHHPPHSHFNPFPKVGGLGTPGSNTAQGDMQHPFGAPRTGKPILAKHRGGQVCDLIRDFPLDADHKIEDVSRTELVTKRDQRQTPQRTLTTLFLFCSRAFKEPKQAPSSSIQGRDRVELGCLSLAGRFATFRHEVRGRVGGEVPLTVSPCGRATSPPLRGGEEPELGKRLRPACPGHRHQTEPTRRCLLQVDRCHPSP